MTYNVFGGTLDLPQSISPANEQNIFWTLWQQYE